MKQSKPVLNRLAPGRTLYSPDDDSHVSKATPLQTKKKELAETRSLEEPRDRARSKETQQIRRKK
jgi:hypothetical protein